MNKYKVYYRTNYLGKSEKIAVGEFINIKEAIDGIIEWLFMNKKGGFNINELRRNLANRNVYILSQKFIDYIDNYGIENFEYDPSYDHNSKDDFIIYYKKKCKNLFDLYKYLKEDGDGYFNLPFGWDIEIIAL